MKSYFTPLPYLLIITAAFQGAFMADAQQDLDTARQIQVQGQATDGSTQISLSLGANDDPSVRLMTANADGTGNFNVPVKLFPGNNIINISSDTAEEQRTVEINVKAPAIRVELTWAGVHQDYDLYVNNVYYGNPSSDGGVLDRDKIDQAEPATENITYSAADAGVYHVFVNYYLPHTVDASDNPVIDPDTNQPVANPVPTTVKIFVNEQQVFSAVQTIQKPEAGIHDGKGTWSVCSLVVHSGTQSGGFQVDDKGFRDIVPQKSVPNRIQPRTPFSISDLTAPSNDDIIFFPVGKAIQVRANGTINVGTDNAKTGVDIIGKFQSTDSTVADVDDLGVVSGIAPGVVTISAASDNPGANGAESGGAQLNAAPNATPAKQVAPTEVVYGKNGLSKGFDPGPKPPWIMVPVGGTNSADNTTIKPAQAAAGRVGFSSYKPSVATASPSVATASPQNVIVTGIASGTANIDAKIVGSNDPLGSMVADVKLTKNLTVAIHQVLLPGQAPLANMPSAIELQTYLNNVVYGIQCNTFFTVTRTDGVINYDAMPGDAKLACGNSPQDHFTPEQTEALKAIPAVNPPVNMDIYIVRDISYLVAASGIAYPVRDKAFVQDPRAGSAPNKELVMNICAHELGHLTPLGRLQDLGKGLTEYAPSGGLPADTYKRLMYHDADAQNPTFLNKTEWNKINRRRLQ